jgi:hypothetical protein
MAQRLHYTPVSAFKTEGREFEMKRAKVQTAFNPALVQTAAWIFVFFGITLGSLLLVA